MLSSAVTRGVHCRRRGHPERCAIDAYFARAAAAGHNVSQHNQLFDFCHERGACLPCLPGEFEQAGACVPCDFAHYQPNFQMPRCFECATGHNTSARGSRLAADCRCQPGFGFLLPSEIAMAHSTTRPTTLQTGTSSAATTAMPETTPVYVAPVMPVITTIPAGNGGAAYTHTLERMVHWKLGTPMPTAAQQNDPGSWRLVRHNPLQSTSWHPKNDNLAGNDNTFGGETYYGTRDQTNAQWSVPFTFRRPAHQADSAYAMPDEMFIGNGDFSKWIYLNRSQLDTRFQGSGGPTSLNVLASSTVSTPHTVTHYLSSAPKSQWISSVAGPTHLSHLIYVEFGDVDYNPQQGGLVFVRLKG